MLTNYTTYFFFVQQIYFSFQKNISILFFQYLRVVFQVSIKWWYRFWLETSNAHFSYTQSDGGCVVQRSMCCPIMTAVPYLNASCICDSNAPIKSALGFKSVCGKIETLKRTLILIRKHKKYEHFFMFFCERKTFSHNTQTIHLQVIIINIREVDQILLISSFTSVLSVY